MCQDNLGHIRFAFLGVSLDPLQEITVDPKIESCSLWF